MTRNADDMGLPPGDAAERLRNPRTTVDLNIPEDPAERARIADRSRPLTIGGLTDLLLQVLNHDIAASLSNEEFELVKVIEMFIDERIRHDREDR